MELDRAAGEGTIEFVNDPQDAGVSLDMATVHAADTDQRVIQANGILSRHRR